MYFTVAVLLGSLLSRSVRSETRFLRPPGPGPLEDYRDNPVFELGEKIDLQWETDLKAVDLLVWQQQPNPSSKTVFARLASSYKSKSLVWTVNYKGFPSSHDPELSEVYFLQLFKYGDTAVNMTSHYFNITQPAAPASASSPFTIRSTPTPPKSISTPASTTPSANPTLEPAAAVPSATPTSGPDLAVKEAGFSSRAVAGIAVGAALGMPLLAGLAWLVWRFRKAWRPAARSAEHAAAPDEGQMHDVQRTPSLPWKLEVPLESHQRFDVRASRLVTEMHEMPAEPVTAEDRGERPVSVVWRTSRPL
ncbi:hypothetical protein CCHL11_02462 [Colletotrichum chlorophyti]|uniref:Mid2 domain-containing protein n=1 Tax=Colletotrichum chlorophyti TaxID=708187 RepID=A0A1Q8S693_9PEZI|nr:hypothetical protein CCHL11_02462 [Colletotrichum chlorophyti]